MAEAPVDLPGGPESGVRDHAPAEGTEAVTRAVKRHVRLLAGVAAVSGAGLLVAVMRLLAAWEPPWRVDALLIGVFAAGVVWVARSAGRLLDTMARTHGAERHTLAHLGAPGGVGYGVCDLVAGTTFWSDESFRIYGLPPGSKPPSDLAAFLALVHPADRRRIETEMGEALGEGKACDLRCRIVHASGEVRAVQCQMDVQHDPDTGRVVRIFGITRDITDTLQLERARRDADTILMMVAEQCREVIWIRDAETGRLVYSSPAFERVTGVPRDRLPDTREEFLELVHPDDREAMRRLYRDVLLGPTTLEWRMVRPDGAVRWISTRAIPLYDGARVPRIAGIAEDVTDQRAAAAAERRRHGELARAAARSAMGEMATALAHEIQQPLFAIRNYARACARQLDRGAVAIDEVRETCDRIRAEADRSADIVGRLRDLARGRPPVTRPDDLNDLVAEALRLAGPETLPPHVTVDLAPDPAAPVAPVDRVGVQQVFLNLVRNAVEAMAEAPGPRHLWVTVASHGTEASVSVGNTGRDLDPHMLDQMFEPFFTTKAEGTGMGLAICRTIVDAHGGRLWAAPREGGGTVVTFTLPLAAPPGAGTN